MENVKSEIEEADGAYRVYLAIHNDEKLSGRFTANVNGAIFFNSKLMNDHSFSEVAVYLSRHWKVNASPDELRQGIMASSKLVQAHRKGGVKVSQRMRDDVDTWLERNPPAPENFTITCRSIAFDIDQNEAELNLRLMEMQIAQILRSKGLLKTRVALKGERHMCWFPAIAVK